MFEMSFARTKYKIYDIDKRKRNKIKQIHEKACWTSVSSLEHITPSLVDAIYIFSTFISKKFSKAVNEINEVDKVSQTIAKKLP